jgi:hypothetical protein
MKLIMLKPATIKSLIMQRINQASIGTVWTPGDFLDLGRRDLVDKTLQRMVTSGSLRRIERGLYDQPHLNPLTRQVTAADYRSIINAVRRRDQVRVLIDVIVHTDGRLSSIQLNNLIIQFKVTAPSKLYWAGRPAMRIVQALHWFHDSLKSDEQLTQEIKVKLIRLLQDSSHGPEICEDLKKGLNTVPLWMRQWIQELLIKAIQKNTGKAS